MKKIEIEVSQIINLDFQIIEEEEGEEEVDVVEEVDMEEVAAVGSQPPQPPLILEVQNERPTDQLRMTILLRWHWKFGVDTVGAREITLILAQSGIRTRRFSNSQTARNA